MQESLFAKKKKKAEHQLWNFTYSFSVSSATGHICHKQVALSQLESINDGDSHLCHKVRRCLSLCVSQRAKEGFPLKAVRVAPGVVFFFFHFPKICVKRAVRHYGCE